MTKQKTSLHKYFKIFLIIVLTRIKSISFLTLFVNNQMATSQMKFTQIFRKITISFYLKWEKIVFLSIKEKENQAKIKQKRRNILEYFFFKSCGGSIRTNDLWVMSPTSYHCSTPRFYFAKIIFYFVNNNRIFFH